MKKIFSLVLFILLYSYVPSIHAQSTEPDCPKGKFDLAGEHSPETQYFTMESRMTDYAPNGKRSGTDIFRLYLKCTPGQINGKGSDQYTCLRFTIQLADSSEAEIPVLRNWSYILSNIPSGIDAKGQVFGIDHSKFNNLTDINGKPVPPDKTYHVYNAFIDFHSINNVFSEKISAGGGIQDLTDIGQKIVHAAAFSEAPVNLGKSIEKGSTFKNGKITLEFKGLSIVNDKQCALIEYDSGESSFNMKMKPMPGFEITTTGSSHYKGDIYKDLKSNWIQKANLSEMVVSQTILPVAPNVINSVVERSITIRNVNENEIPGAN